MSRILKRVPSPDWAHRYRELEWEAERAAATVPPLYRESFKRMARKWRQLAEQAERGSGLSTHSRRMVNRDSAFEY
jgi:hypothetical protein